MTFRHLVALALAILGSASARAQQGRRVHIVPAPSAARSKRPAKAGTQSRVQKGKASAARPSREHVAPAPKARVVETPTPALAPPPGSELAVTLITFGVGPEIWERFGHNALWIHDEKNGTDVAYNWGLFDFEQPDFMKRFLTGDTKYWMGSEDALTMVSNYHNIGRPVTLQRLNLTPAQALALRDFVEWNAREENKYYRYDYFRDNCSTRLRDALDRALGGALRAATDGQATDLTYRGESLRLVDGDLPVQVGMDIALGRRADEPLTAWQAFFIPMRLRDAVRRLAIPGPDGTPVKLVTDEQVIAPAPGTQPITEATDPPDLTVRATIAGLLLALVAFGLRVMMRTRRGAAWGLALLGAAWSLLCGALGVMLLIAWFATKHVFWAWNENLLLCSPLWIPLVILIPAALLASRGVGKARVLTAINALLGVAALVLALVYAKQDNLAIIALFLPMHLAFAWALSRPLPSPAPRAGKKE